jgi:hypothetical protein
MASENASDSDNVSAIPPKARRRSKRPRSTAKPRPGFAPLRPALWQRYAAGESIRSIARSEHLDRTALSKAATREGWREELHRLHEAAAARASKKIENRLAELKATGLMARLGITRRVSRAVKRRRIDAGEAAGLRDLATAVKASDLQSEASRAPQVNIDNRNLVGISMAEALEASRALDIPRPRIVAEDGVILEEARDPQAGRKPESDS